MRLLPIISIVFLLSAPSPAIAGESLRIAAASSLRFVLGAVAEAWRLTEKQGQIELIFGSSGKLRAQIEHGAPFDLFLSANMEYPRILYEKGLSMEPPVSFALGRLVIWSRTRQVKGMEMKNLLGPQFIRIAIANPAHAPYGKRAKEALQAGGMWGPLHSRFVYGENIGQTAHMVESGAADVGIIARSLALSPPMKKRGSHALISSSAHAPLKHGAIITKASKNKKQARDFINFMQSEPLIATWERFGFETPQTANAR